MATRYFTTKPTALREHLRTTKQTINCKYSHKQQRLQYCTHVPHFLLQTFTHSLQSKMHTSFGTNRSPNHQTTNVDNEINIKPQRFNSKSMFAKSRFQLVVRPTDVCSSHTFERLHDDVRTYELSFCSSVYEEV